MLLVHYQMIQCSFFIQVVNIEYRLFQYDHFSLDCNNLPAISSNTYELPIPQFYTWMGYESLWSIIMPMWIEQVFSHFSSKWLLSIHGLQIKENQGDLAEEGGKGCIWGYYTNIWHFRKMNSTVVSCHTGEVGLSKSSGLMCWMSGAGLVCEPDRTHRLEYPEWALHVVQYSSALGNELQQMLHTAHMAVQSALHAAYGSTSRPMCSIRG